MNLLNLETGHLWVTLGSAVLHFLWQGLLIWCLSYVIISLLRHKSAQAKHLVACVALMTCMLCFITTCIVLAKSELHTLSMADANTHATGPMTDAEESLSAFSVSTLAAWLWCIGGSIMALRMGRNWFAGHRLQTTMATMPEAPWLRLFESVKQDMNVVRSVCILQSALAEVPMVVGWFRPVILIPASAFTSLTPEQMRIVLAHELSHICRKDHILNLLQNIIEVALFFHPVTWWLSKQIRIEREHCCDDACLDVTGTPKSLINTLLQLEYLRTRTQTNISLQATGGSLMNRITRLINSNYTHTPAPMWKAFSFCTAMAITAAIGLTTVAITSPATAQDRTTESEAGQDHSTDGPFPSKESMDEGVSAEVERGNLTEIQATAIMRVYARLAMGLESNKLSESDAIAILGERVKAIYEEEQDQPSITRKDYADAQAAMQKMVDAGEITQEQMDAKLIEMRKMISRSQPSITRKDYADAQAAMQKMVDAGEITQEQMDARLIEMRKMISKSQPSITRKDYANAQAAMQKKVDAGEITQEQMQQRLDRMKAAMAQQSKPKMTRKDYADAQAAMQKMVDAEEITQEQMRQRLDRMKAAMAQQSKPKMTRKDYADEQAAMQKMVDTGEITQEQMDAKLIEMRKMISRSQPSITRKNYADAQESMQKMVDAGEITQEQMQQRLDRRKAAMAQQSKPKMTHKDFPAAVAKMIEMVKSGKMTRKQMQQRLEAMRDEAPQADSSTPE